MKFLFDYNMKTVIGEMKLLRGNKHLRGVYVGGWEGSWRRDDHPPSRKNPVI